MNTTEDLYRGRELPDRLVRGLRLLAGAGALVFLVGIVAAPGRAWGGFLIGFNYFVGLALAGPLFLAVLYLARARWSRELRFVPEAMGAALPAAFVMGLVLIMGTHTLYEWSHPQIVNADPLLAHKAPWLNVTGFTLRLVAYFALWIWASRKLVARSSASEPQPERSRNDIRVSALFMAILAVTFSLASVDWIQSLDPHWFSTIFALRTLAGLASAGAALCTIVLVVLRRRGVLREAITKDVLDDLGKILLSLCLFWGYIWYCQYMIIWYSDMPEETGYYLLRREGDWSTLVPLNLLVNFAVPFLALMPRAWRRSGVVLARIAAWILCGHALDLFIMIAPPLMGGTPHIGVWELGPLAGALGLFGWIMVRRLSRGAEDSLQRNSA